MADFATYDEFFAFYLREHSKPATRQMHFVGTTGTLLFLLAGIGYGRPLFFLAALLCGYGFAWVSHFFIEKNRPATFKYPLRSFVSDWKMWALMLTGKIGAELEKAGVKG